MRENIEQMQERHEREISELQNNCSHTHISDWMDYMWAPGHCWGRVKVCENCGKIIESSVPQVPKFETKWSAPNGKMRIFLDDLTKENE